MKAKMTQMDAAKRGIVTPEAVAVAASEYLAPEFIRDGVAAANFGSSRFGQYLGVEKPTGNLPCIRAEAGTLTDADMNKAPYLDCASLSGLQLDLYNDYIGGEIRLAYYFDGEKTVPVTGISMSGKLSAALAALRLSDRMVTEGAYEGPQYLLLKGMTVL